MHAKLVLVDGQRAFVGSQNFSAVSLDANREVGVIVADTAVVAQLASVAQGDWDTAQEVRELLQEGVRHIIYGGAS